MKTFYRPEMNVYQNQSFSPSAGKPKAFIEYLQEKGIKLDLISDFDPASSQDLGLAHDKSMVQEILDLRMRNGFGNTSEEVARSLPYTTGSFLAAARYAVKNQENTFSPTSGFHHAGFSYCGGFCTFNGLMVSALKILELGLVKKVGILDLDAHYGDGTEDIISKLRLSSVYHYTFGGKHITLQDAEGWLDRFNQELMSFSQCEVIFYQAGADPHIEDPLGGSLTTLQMKRRDEMIFRRFRELKIPVVWNLAGGYQSPLEKVLKLHATTYKLAV